MSGDRFHKKFDRWKSALLDLTGRNRLLRHRAGAGSLRIVRPGAADVLKRLVDEKRWRVCLRDPDAKHGKKKDAPPPVADADMELADGELLGHVRGKKAERALTQLMRSLRGGLEEQGTHTLFLAIGMLRWSEGEKARDKDWAAPLVIVPVTLERRSMRDPFRMALAEEETGLNPALVEKLRVQYSISLPPLPEALEEFDPLAWGAEVQALVAPLEGWTVAPDELWLDRFDFAKVALYQHLLHHAATYEQHPIVRALAGDVVALPRPPADVPGTGELDASVPVGESWHVLDADSSQHAAIEAVRRGGNLVLEGPPGTGKSQTIANMVAELMAAGKKVLFVSEKRAALEVVWRRLEKTGLGPYCLDLHNPKLVNKKTVAQELYAAWRGRTRTPDAPFVDFALVQEYRDRLNGYVAALHDPVGKLQMAPWAAYARFWHVVDAPDLRYALTAPLEIDSEQLRALEEGVERLTNHIDVLRQPAAHPWCFVDTVDTSLKFREAVEDAFRDAGTALGNVHEWAMRVARDLGVDPPTTLAQVDTLARQMGSLLSWPGEVPPPRAWFREERLPELLDLVHEAGRRGPRMKQNEERILSRYHERFLERPDLAEMEGRARTPPAWWLRWLPFGAVSRWRQDRQLMRTYLLPEVKFDARTIAADCMRAQTLREDRQWFLDHRARLTSGLGDWFFSGTDTHWDEVVLALEWVAERRREQREERPGEAMLETLFDSSRREHWRKRAEDGERYVTIARARLEKVRNRFAQLDRPASPLSEDDQPVTAMRDWFGYRLDVFERLHEWMAWLRAERALADAGFHQIIHALSGTKLSVAEIVPAVQKRFWLLWLDAAQLEPGALNGFRGDDHENVIARFRRLDALVPQTGALRVTEAIEEQRPKHTGYMPAGSELQILNHQASLKRGHLTVRRLLQRIPRLALALKPCWMMSPLSAGQFLTPEHRFDVVIFDEASQVPPEDAIPSILHAAQAVIVGDRQQLPPSSFFQQAGNELEMVDEEDIDLVPLESVLEEAARFFPVRRLQWHYRSRDESLIAFSNKAFYDDQLVTFPAPRVNAAAVAAEGNGHTPASASAQRRAVSGRQAAISGRQAAVVLDAPSDAPAAPDALPASGNGTGATPGGTDHTGGTGDTGGTPLGIEFVRLPREMSAYHKGANKPEAQLVVERLVQVARECPDYSIGVVAFGIAQAALIEDLLEEARSRDPELDRRFDPEQDEPVFVKNLETVQGDERDIIIFSVTYGPDADNQLRLNFGPIQNPGGERRLNVAFTRARYQIVLCSSLGARDIDPGRARSEGATLLREYLDFAESGGHLSRASADDPGSRRLTAMEDALVRALDRRGFEVHRAVGQGPFRMDLAVVHPKHPGQYVLGVETDGGTYRACATARDRDRTRPDMLRHLGWNLARVWSRDRFERPEEVVETLVRQIEAQGADAVRFPRPEPKKRFEEDLTATPVDALSDAPAADPADATRRVFATYREARLEQPAGVEQLTDLDEEVLARLVQTIVEIEGPVHREMIYARLTAVWDVKRRSKSITDAMDQAIETAKAHGWAKQQGDFYWPPHRTAAFARVPDRNAAPRDIQHICTAELDATLLAIVAAAMSISRDDLLASAAQTLGYARLGTRIQARLQQVLNGLMTTGKLKEVDDGMLTLAG